MKALVTFSNDPQKAMVVFTSAHLKGKWDGEYILLTSKIKKDHYWFNKNGVKIIKVSSLFEIFKLRFELILYVSDDTLIENNIAASKITSIRAFAAVQHHNIRLSNQFINPDYLGAAPKEKIIFKKLSKNFNMNRYTFHHGVFAFRPKMFPDAYMDLKKLQAEYQTSARYADESILNLYFQQWEPLPGQFNMQLDKYSLFPYIDLSKLNAYIFFLASDEIKKKNNYINKKIIENKRYANLINLQDKKTDHHLRILIDRYIPHRLFGIMGLIIRKYFPLAFFIIKSTNSNQRNILRIYMHNYYGKIIAEACQRVINRYLPNSISHTKITIPQNVRKKLSENEVELLTLLGQQLSISFTINKSDIIAMILKDPHWTDIKKRFSTIQFSNLGLAIKKRGLHCRIRL